MEEKRRQFDAAKVKVGDVVETRDGRKAKILCTDANEGDLPIIVLIYNYNYNGMNCPLMFTRDGRIRCESGETAEDLFMPLKEHKMFMPVFRHKDGYFVNGAMRESIVEVEDDIKKYEDEGKKLGLEYECTVEINFKE